MDDHTGIRHRSRGKNNSTAGENVEDLGKSDTKYANVWHWFVSWLTQPEDPANLALFRILFGILMMVDIPQERGMAVIPYRWRDPSLCYFPLFDWLRPLPVEWMYVVYLIMYIGAFGIALGCCYRTSCVFFVVPYWYIFWLDKCAWNNHSYLYGLIGIMLLITDADQYWSVDGMFKKSIQNTCVPRWNYWLIKFQIVLVYFYAGLKKLDADWMSGYSMVGLAQKWVFDPFRLIVSDEFIELYMVHICGLGFDLLEGFLLLFDKTRLIGVFFGCSFHLMNSQMFSIGMFPYTMLATIPFFFHAAWPRRLVRKMPAFFSLVLPSKDDPKINECFTAKQDNKKANKELDACEERFVFIKKSFWICVASFFVLIQLFLPWSHFITQGYNGWTNGLYGYSWDMMVHSWSTQHVRIEVVDQATNKSNFFIPGVWVGGNENRNGRWTSHPDMIKQYARCLARKVKEHESLNISEPAIYFDVWRSMNHRFQQRMFDPRVDIVKAPWSTTEITPWVLPLLIDLSPWRKKFQEIEKEVYAKSNFTDVVFVADFPGLSLENFVNADMNASVTVLQGTVKVEEDGKNVTLGEEEVYVVKSNDTHIVYTVSDTPASWMYYFTNVTLANNVTLQNILKDEHLSRMNSTKWTNMTVVEKFQKFMMKKVAIFHKSFSLSFRAVKTIILGEEPLDSDDGTE